MKKLLLVIGCLSLFQLTPMLRGRLVQNLAALGARSSSTVAPQIWEYKTFKVHGDKWQESDAAEPEYSGILTKMAQEGWELNFLQSAECDNGQFSEHHLIFRRRITRVNVTSSIGL